MFSAAATNKIEPLSLLNREAASRHKQEKIDQAKPHHAHKGDIERAMGSEAWSRLPPAVRDRFCETTAMHRDHHYAGVMSKVQYSAFGWVMIQLCRLIGTPFATGYGTDVPTVVDVHPNADRTGICWDRTYRFAEKNPVTVSSTKILAPYGKLLECVGRGFGMVLDVYEQDEVLVFESRRFFAELFGHRFYLPTLLSPGSAVVTHTDLGGDNFQFEMTFKHPILGLLVYQIGTFSERKG